MPYLHLPVQAGSDKILKAMNRAHTAESYLRLIEKIRAARPDIAIVRRLHRGLPGRARRRLRGDARSWSARSATPAPSRSSIRAAPARRPPPCPARWPRRSKAERLARLNALLDEQQTRLQRPPGRQDPAGAVREARPPPRPGRRPQSLSAGRSARGAPDRPDRPDRSGAHRVVGPDSLAGALETRPLGACLSRAPRIHAPVRRRPSAPWPARTAVTPP